MCHFVSLLFICFPNHQYHQHYRWLVLNVMTSKIWVHKWLVNILRTLIEFLQHSCRVGILSLYTNMNLKLKGFFPTCWKWGRSQIFSPSILCPLHFFFLRRMPISFVAERIQTISAVCLTIPWSLKIHAGSITILQISGERSLAGQHLLLRLTYLWKQNYS